MEPSIKQISNGIPFMVDFKKIVVSRCHYINAVEERVESTSILSDAEAVISRVTNNGTIFIQVTNKISRKEFPLAQFRVNATYYHKDEHTEISQTAMVRGNEITEELPISYDGLEYGKINLFTISRQQGRVVAFLILNPPNVEDYYYRVMFDQFLNDETA